MQQVEISEYNPFNHIKNISIAHCSEAALKHIIATCFQNGEQLMADGSEQLLRADAAGYFDI